MKTRWFIFGRDTERFTFFMVGDEAGYATREDALEAIWRFTGPGHVPFFVVEGAVSG